MTLLSVLATVFGVTTSFAIFLQAYKIFQRKSAKDVSILMYLIAILNGIVWVLYAFEIKSFPIIIANGVAGIAVILIFIGWFKYGRK